MDKKDLIPLIIIEGPTASGKSEFAFELAQVLESEIVSADSRQIYRYMNIGTAKPSKHEISTVPHHLINIIDPDEEYSAGRYVNDASTIISQIHQKKNSASVKNKTALEQKVPIIAGGTGFYVQAVLEGLFEEPKVNETIREELELFENDKGSEYLYNILLKVDSESAQKIHPNDSYRLKRALEVWIATGKGISSHWKEQKRNESIYNPFRILITEDRATLYNRINIRLEKMIEMGLIEEIQGLLNRGFKETDPGLSSVGYKEFIPYITKSASFFQCLEEAKKNSRKYAKRQLTWYRKIDYHLLLRRNGINIDTILKRVKKHFE